MLLIKKSLIGFGEMVNLCAMKMSGALYNNLRVHCIYRIEC